MGNEFFDGLSDTITKTARELGKQAEQIYEFQKVRSKRNNEERLAEEAKTDLGNLIYQRYMDGEELDQEITELCRKVTKHLGMASRYHEQMAAMKGCKICPSCQQAVDMQVSFCPYCGTPCRNTEKENENLQEDTQREMKEKEPESSQTEEAQKEDAPFQKETKEEEQRSMEEEGSEER